MSLLLFSIACFAANSDFLALSSSKSDSLIAVSDKIVKGGILITDNVLWSGKVLEPSKSSDIETEILNKFNQLLKKDKKG